MKEPMNLTIMDIARIIAEAEEMNIAIGIQMTPINKNKVVKDADEEKKVEITKEQAEALADFLEAEFIKDGKGIGSDPDLKDNEYVNCIREVYDKLQEVCKDETR